MSPFWFNFKAITQATNKVFIVFSPKEIFLDTNTFSISTSFSKIGNFMAIKFIFVNFNITKRSNFFLHFNKCQ